MASGELALFGAWCDLVEETEVSPSGDRKRTTAGDVTTLPLDAVPPLATVLEALLRVQEVDAFATLVALLDGCPIDARERRHGSSRWRRRPGGWDRRMRRPALKFRRRRSMLPGEPIDRGQRDDPAGRHHEELDMSLDVASIAITSFSAAPERGPRASRDAGASGGADRAAISSGEVPASPPAEVLEAMDAPARVARELHEQGRELRFTSGEDGLRIELRDLDGNVLRTIPPSELLDIATGAKPD
jgi:flagellar protein FlaG